MGFQMELQGRWWKWGKPMHKGRGAGWCEPLVITDISLFRTLGAPTPFAEIRKNSSLAANSVNGPGVEAVVALGPRAPDGAKEPEPLRLL